MILKPFQYKPLDLKTDSIRLLQVNGIDDSERPRLTVRHARISSSRYYAVSYTWGSEIDQAEIIVNNHVFTVRRNIYNFLKTLIQNSNPRSYVNDPDCSILPNFDSHESDSPVISHLDTSEQVDHAKEQPQPDDYWIDAICLDQSSTSERNHQVARMYNIYHSAAFVIVWLGCGDQSIVDSLARMEGKDLGNLQGENFKITNDEGLLSLFNLSYWRRAWVLQELMAADEIFLLYDHFWMPWDNLWSSVWRTSWWEDPVQFETLSQTKAYDFFTFRRDGSVKVSIKDILILFTGLECADIRDRIYSIRSLVQSTSDFIVDYHEDVPSLAIRTAIHFGLEYDFELVLVALEINRQDWDELIEGRGRYLFQWSGPRWFQRGFRKTSNCPGCQLGKGTFWSKLPQDTLVMCLTGENRKTFGPHFFSFEDTDKSVGPVLVSPGASWMLSGWMALEKEKSSSSMRYIGPIHEGNLHIVSKWQISFAKSGWWNDRRIHQNRPLSPINYD